MTSYKLITHWFIFTFCRLPDAGWYILEIYINENFNFNSTFLNNNRKEVLTFRIQKYLRFLIRCLYKIIPKNSVKVVDTLSIGKWWTFFCIYIGYMCIMYGFCWIKYDTTTIINYWSTWLVYIPILTEIHRSTPLLVLFKYLRRLIIIMYLCFTLYGTDFILNFWIKKVELFRIRDHELSSFGNNYS